MDKPEVSVVTTVYNGEPYFERVVPSILNQTYKTFEWIIVDDGSEDGTRQLLLKLAREDSRVKVFAPGRLGRARALNYAIQNAHGHFIVQQDFDDLSYPERIEIQIDFLKRNPDIGAVGAYYIVRDSIRNEQYVRKPPLTHEEIVNAMVKYIPFAHTLVTFRKKAWEDVGGYPLVTDIVDLRMWIKFVKAGWRLANIPKILGEHFVHSASFWHRQFKYIRRQRELAFVQSQAIRELGLPRWTYIYPLGRLLYAYMPKGTKRWLRRALIGLKEEDLHAC